MSDIIFQVVDTVCENTDKSFFPPAIALSTHSVTRIATVLGFDEYPGFNSIPPKRYKTLTWQGSSEAQLWKGAGEQIAGARFDYSGSSTIDTNGNYTNTYTKNLFEMCNATNDGLVTCFVARPTGGIEEYTFPGWMGPSGHQKCSPPGTPYSLVGNRAIGRGDAARFDSSGLWGSKSNGQANSNIKVSDFNSLSATFALCVDSGGSPEDATIIALLEPVPHNVVPPINNETEGTVWFFAGIVWSHDYSATLSNEYTDSEAYNNAQIIVGNSAVAENFPRTTGFVSTFTSVNFTLACSNLVVGSNYVVSVEFWDPSTGSTTTRQYGLAATGTVANISDVVPTPSVQHRLQVRNPKISFST